MMSWQPGRWILMATTFPLATSRALNTCPMEAAATGSGSTNSKTSSKRTPSSSSMVLIATSFGKGGNRSWSRWSSSRYSLGSRSGRLARACPPLMIAGPSPAMISCSSWARWRRRSRSLPAWMSPTTRRRNRDKGKKSSTLRLSQSSGWRKRRCSASAGSYATVGSATRVKLSSRIRDTAPSGSGRRLSTSTGAWDSTADAKSSSAPPGATLPWASASLSRARANRSEWVAAPR
mmetsp:Transcript_29099/g.84950  ORF Transcript_29099/g.84950 Transcript_29099/m.84950 type:complete len:234 (-) Transcript_29099:228-929(-)